MNSIKSIINKNIFLLDLATRAYFYRKNSETKRALKPVLEIDPITDFDDFKNAVIKFKQTKGQREWLGLNGIAGDSSLYGHLYALCQYASIEYTDRTKLLLPAIEHGISWLDKEMPSDALPYTHCIVSQGPYRHRSIRRQARVIPHYIIGPFIHYAKSYFDNTKLQQMKECWKKTLLVFPAHTYELGTSDYSREEYVSKLFTKVKDTFDTIVVSAYWNDVDDPMVSLFKERGALIVSSGLREDPNFLPRLKSLLLLADATTGNTLGTNIGYSLYLKKPFFYFDGHSGVKYEDFSSGQRSNSIENKHMANLISEAEGAFCCLKPTAHQLTLQKQFYNRFWGQDSYIKSPDEIRYIFEISLHVLKETRGNVSSFAYAYLNYLNELKLSNEKKYILLKNALD